MAGIDRVDDGENGPHRELSSPVPGRTHYGRTRIRRAAVNQDRMSSNSNWRNISSEEVAVVKAIVLGSGLPEGSVLVDRWMEPLCRHRPLGCSMSRCQTPNPGRTSRTVRFSPRILGGLFAAVDEYVSDPKLAHATPIGGSSVVLSDEHVWDNDDLYGEFEFSSARAHLGAVKSRSRRATTTFR